MMNSLDILYFTGIGPPPGAPPHNKNPYTILPNPVTDTVFVKVKFFTIEIHA